MSRVFLVLILSASLLVGRCNIINRLRGRVRVPYVQTKVIDKWMDPKIIDEQPVSDYNRENRYHMEHQYYNRRRHHSDMHFEHHMQMHSHIPMHQSYETQYYRGQHMAGQEYCGYPQQQMCR